MNSASSTSRVSYDSSTIQTYLEIKERFGCLAKLNQTVSQQCLRTCTSHHNAVTSLMQNFKHLALNGMKCLAG